MMASATTNSSNPPASGGQSSAAGPLPLRQSSSSTITSNPLNLDGNNFDCEAYMSQMLKKKSVKELLDEEHKIVGEVRLLDSDMQQLVYENYSKFITATDTIRKMKSDFVRMEDEMDKLSLNMGRITHSSQKIANALSGQRENIQTLARTSATLKNLEFIFDLPENLKNYVERKEYSLAVKSYTKARGILEQYKDIPTFQSIYNDCQATVEELRDVLKEEFRGRIGSTKEVGLAMSDLIRLGEPRESLAAEFLRSASVELNSQMNSLRDQNRLLRGDSSQMTSTTPVAGGTTSRPSDAIPNLPIDVLEFVDSGCSTFLSDLSLTIASYHEMFLDVSDADRRGSKREPLEKFGSSHVEDLVAVAEERFLHEKNPSDNGLVVRAMDRFYRRLQANQKWLAWMDVGSAALDILIRTAQHQVTLSHGYLHTTLMDELKDIRQQVAATQKAFLAPPTGPNSDSNQILSELLTRLENSVTTSLKTSLANLLQFTAQDVTFAAASDGAFIRSFGLDVRRNLVVRFFDTIAELADEFCEGKADKAYVNATLILLLSKFAKNLEASTAGYILDLCEQQFKLTNNDGNGFESAERVTKKLGTAGQRLLDHYVTMEGSSISQLLVKSVETRDWLGCVEPRAVRAVMKRVVEDLTLIDTKVGQLFEEGSRKDQSSDSSRRTAGMHSVTSRAALKLPTVGSGTVSVLGNSALSNTLGKLWTERIDYFSSVEFTKVSVLTGIVKICLKTLLESVRMKTFNRYGLQQVQVDAHYLQLYLWRFVSDEHLVHCLLDEVVSSAVHRSTQPQLMEPSVVELICERG